MNGFDVGSWLSEIVKNLTVSRYMRISVGFSFIGVKYEKTEPKFIYFYAAQELCTINGTFRKRSQARKFAKNLEGKPYYEFLSETFLETESGDPFANSGIGPHCLVACFVWITK